MPHPDDVQPETDKDSQNESDTRARPGAFETAPRFSPLPEEPVEETEDES